jgi:hypothetical protein
MLGLFAVFGGLLCAAFLRRPALRTAAFSGLGGGVIFMHWHVVDAPLLAECVLYAACALSFVRWALLRAGRLRPAGLRGLQCNGSPAATAACRVGNVAHHPDALRAASDVTCAAGMGATSG